MAASSIPAGVNRPGKVRNDVGAGDGAPHRGGIADIAFGEMSRAGPALRSVAGQADDIVALAEEPADDTATHHSAGPGDGDSHRRTLRLVVIVEEGGAHQIVEIHVGEVLLGGLSGSSAVGFVGQ